MVKYEQVFKLTITGINKEVLKYKKYPPGLAMVGDTLCYTRGDDNFYDIYDGSRVMTYEEIPTSEGYDKRYKDIIFFDI